MTDKQNSKILFFILLAIPFAVLLCIAFPIASSWIIAIIAGLFVIGIWLFFLLESAVIGWRRDRL